MRKITSLILVLLISISFAGMVIAEESGAYFNIGDYNEEVIAIHRKLTDLGYIGTMRAESPWNEKSVRALMILQENLKEEVTGVVENIEQLEKYLTPEKVIGKNFAVETSNGWCDWMTPDPDKENRTFNPFFAVLPSDKAIGDYFTCSVEIEFKDVTEGAGDDGAFSFRTQGAVDGTWEVSNIWNSSIVKLYEVPVDGVYQYSKVVQITEKNVEAEKFNLGYRCDYWGSGSFRVRNVKVERGNKATEWIP